MNIAKSWKISWNAKDNVGKCKTRNLGKLENW